MYQLGFRTNHSLIDFVLTGVDKQMHTGMLLVDLQKTFDTLDHGVLLKQNKCFGFRTSVIKCFEPYLSNRTFLVCINVISEARTLSTVYHKALFLDCPFFYFMQMTFPSHYKKLVPICMEMTLVFSTNMRTLKNEIVFNKEFWSLCQWFTDNKLPIHFGEDKTKSILISKTRGLREINISFAGHSIKQHETVEYLGY